MLLPFFLTQQLITIIGLFVLGLDILSSALRTPCMIIADNAGADSGVIVNKVNIN